MKPNILSLPLSLIIALFAISCNKENQIFEPKQEYATLTINITNPTTEPQTKLTGSEFENATLTHTIRGLDFLVFDYNTNKLETHERINDTWSGFIINTGNIINQRQFELNIKKGQKKIIVIANSQHSKNEIFSNYASGNMVGMFAPLRSDVFKELPSTYTMYWTNDSPIDINTNTNISVQLTKIVSRIILRNITSPTQGNYKATLKNYLRNASIGFDGAKSYIYSLEFSAASDYYGDNFLSSGSMDNNQVRSSFNLSANVKKNISVYLYIYPIPANYANAPDWPILTIGSGSNQHTLSFREIKENTSYEFENITLTSSSANHIITEYTPTSTKVSDNWISENYFNLEL